MKFEELCQEYIDSVPLAESTRYVINQKLNIFLKYFKDKEVNEIKEQNLKKLKENEMKLGKKETTVINYFKIIKPIFSWGVKKGYIKINPVANFKVSYRTGCREKIKKEAVDSILKHAKEYDLKLYLAILLMTSLKISRGEICAIKWEDINFPKYQVSITKSVAQKKGGSFFKDTPNGNRIVKLDSNTANILKKYKATGCIIKSNRQDFISPNYLNFLFNNFRKKNKINGMLKDFSRL